MKHFLGKRLFSVVEVAALTGFSASAVNKLVSETTGGLRRVGGRVYITESGIQDAFDLNDHEFAGFISLAEKRDAAQTRAA